MARSTAVVQLIFDIVTPKWPRRLGSGVDSLVQLNSNTGDTFSYPRPHKTNQLKAQTRNLAVTTNARIHPETKARRLYSCQ